MASKGGLILGFSLFVLLSVVTVPVAINASQGDVTETITLESDETQTLGTDLEITVDETDTNEVTITLVNLQDGETETDTIPEGNTTEFEFNGDTVSVTAEDTSNQRATLVVEYPSTFGYSEAAVTIRDNLPIILVGMVFLGVMGIFRVIQ